MSQETPANSLAHLQENLFGQEPEEFWKTVIDTMMDGLLIVDPQGAILAVNAAMEEITGYRREELVGQPCTILKCPTCLDAVVRGGGRSASCSGAAQSTAANAPWSARTAATSRF